MNECLKVLQTRRSVKSYNDKPVPKEYIDEILKAGVNAPTGKNVQSPVMVLVTDPEMISYISKLNGRVINAGHDVFYGAKTLIIVFADSSMFTYVEDGSLVMGNLLNAAESLGVGACWIHRAREVFKTPEGKKLMEKWGLDERYIGIGNCILGYTDNPPAPKEHKADYVIYDK